MKYTVLFLCAVLLFVFHSIFFSGKTLYYGDNFTLMVPGKIYAANALKKGILPFWNPYIFSGTPFFADINQSVLYPTTLLFLAFPPAVAVNITVVFHLFWSALGVWSACRLLGQSRVRALMGSLVWMFSGYMLAVLSNFAILQSASWIPWMFLCVSAVLHKHRRARVARFVLPLVVLLAILGGHPQPVTYTVLFLSGYVLWYPGLSLRWKLRQFVLPAVLCLGMGAAAIVPFLEISSLSTRALMTTQEVLAGSIHPLIFLQWFIPNLFSNPALGVSWGPEWGILKQADGYMTLTGLIGLFVLIFSKKKTPHHAFLLVSGAVALIVALGRYIPGAQYVYNAFPVLRLLRNPAGALILWTFCASLLVGDGVKQLAAFLKTHKYANMFRFFIWSIVFLVFSALFTQQYWMSPVWKSLSLGGFHTIARDTLILKNMLMSAVVTFLSAGIIFELFRKKQVKWFAVLIVMFLDLWFAARTFLFFAPASVYDQTSKQAAFLSPLLNNYRFSTVTDYLPYSGFFSYFHDVVTKPPFMETRFTAAEAKTFTELRNRRDNLGADWGMVYGLPTTYGYSTFVLQTTSNYWRGERNGSNINDSGKVRLDDLRLSDQGVRYFLIDSLIYPEQYILERYPRLRVIHRDSQFVVMENPDALPVVRVSEKNSHAVVSNVSIGGNIIKFQLSADKETPVAIREFYYPGWTCSFDSTKSCSIEQVDGGMSVRVPTGDTTVILSFQPRWWRYLLLTSLLFAGFYGVWVVFSFFSFADTIGVWRKSRE